MLTELNNSFVYGYEDNCKAALLRREIDVQEIRR